MTKQLSQKNTAEERMKRLSSALKENLARRKQQQSARKTLPVSSSETTKVSS